MCVYRLTGVRCTSLMAFDATIGGEFIGGVQIMRMWLTVGIGAAEWKVHMHVQV